MVSNIANLSENINKIREFCTYQVGGVGVDDALEVEPTAQFTTFCRVHAIPLLA